MTVILFNSVLIVLLLGFIIHQVRNIWDANNFIHIEIKKVLNELLEDFSVAKMHDHQLLRKIQAYSELLEQTDNKESTYLHKRLDVLIENSTFAVERLGILLKLADEHLRKIETHTKFLCDISHKLDNIEDNILDDLRDIRLADKLGKTSPNVPAPLPCYAPNGICTNPQMDCINCPKRGTGGVWSTSTNTIKVKGKRCELTDEELIKRINEDNKED